jgi:glycosyltransferase involved in cell wall biosynthesis
MFSIILTVHDKEYLIHEVLSRIVKNTIGSYEINVVIDGCNDASEIIVDKFISQNKNIKINKFNTNDVFETKANNVGLKNSNGDYCIIVQDDMLINEVGWNERLLKPINQYSDVFAVTGRHSHNWIHNINSIHQHMEYDLDNCWCDILLATDVAGRENIDRDTFAIRDSVNRGPLLIRHDILQKVNYLDEIFAPQDMDDHDLSYRVYKETGLVAGCYWIDIISEPSWGGTRKNGGPAPWLLKSQHKNMKIVWNRHKDLIIGNKHNENRRLP